MAVARPRALQLHEPPDGVRRRMIESGISGRNLAPRRGHGERLLRPAEVLTPSFLKATVTTGQIADKTGFNRSTVRYYVRQAGSPIRPVGFTGQYDIKAKERAKLRRQGRSSRQIADNYGSSVTTVERALRRYGLVGGGTANRPSCVMAGACRPSAVA